MTKQVNIKTYLTIICVAFFMLLLNGLNLEAHEFSGFVSGEGWFFPSEPLYQEQKSVNVSIAMQPEYYHQFKEGSSFTFVPFARLDSADSERSHMDIRELNYLWLGDSWELLLGVGKVFWGTTESVHLVDIINQTDLVEGIDGEEKLGQPMVALSVPKDWGTIDLFILPYFRERTFPGKDGRLRTEIVIDTDNAKYESSAGTNHIDFAFRYSHSLGNWDMGISHFMGTGREPTLIFYSDENSQATLLPYYEQINQTGLDLQMIAGEWLWKAETIYRSGQGDDFFSVVGGFEYTFTGLVNTNMDLGIISEWIYDNRGDQATSPYENDVMAGFRLTFNDISNSQILAGVVQDLSSSTRIFSIEASRRIGTHLKLNLDSFMLINPSENDPVYDLRNDSFLRLTLSYYY